MKPLNKKHLSVSISLLLLFLTTWGLFKRKETDFIFDSYHIICQDLIWICFFLFLISIYLFIKNKMNKILRVISLLVTLSFFPTVNSNIKPECNHEGGNNIIGEDYYQSNREYFTLVPFTYAFLNLFNEPRCSKTMNNYELKSYYSLLIPFKNIGISNIYFIHMFSVLLNCFLIFFTFSVIYKSHKN
jgi:hypothetical protein